MPQFLMIDRIEGSFKINENRMNFASFFPKINVNDSCQSEHTVTATSILSESHLLLRDQMELFNPIIKSVINYFSKYFSYAIENRYTL